MKQLSLVCLAILTSIAFSGCATTVDFWKSEPWKPYERTYYKKGEVAEGVSNKGVGGGEMLVNCTAGKNMAVVFIWNQKVYPQEKLKLRFDYRDDIEIPVYSEEYAATNSDVAVVIDILNRFSEAKNVEISGKSVGGIELPTLKFMSASHLWRLGFNRSFTSVCGEHEQFKYLKLGE